MSVEIRKFRLEDLKAVLSLSHEAREYHRQILNGYFTVQKDEEEQILFLESLKNENITVWVAVLDGQVQGLLAAEKRKVPHLEKPCVSYIQNIYVRKSLRGQGIGKKMMDVFLTHCRKNGIQEIKLGVFNKNISACAFYEKYGFEAQEQKMSLMADK